MPLKNKAFQPVSSAPRDLNEVTKALYGGTDDERWAAARAARQLPGCAKALGAALAGESNPRVREAMFTSLAVMATAESIEVLLPFVRSDEAFLRTGALDALHAMKTEVRPYLPRLLGDADADVRLLACELVRNAPSHEATLLLCALLDREVDPNVCACAVDVLAEIGGPDALPALARCLERFREIPFLAFSIKIAADRVRAQNPQAGG